MSPLPASIVAVLQPFACLFTHPTWVHVQVLLAGTLLAQGPRTVTAALLLVGDGAYACVQLGLKALRVNVTLVSRLRLDARLFAFPEAPVPGQRGPKPKKGAALEKLSARVEEARTQGALTTVKWYGQPKTVRLLSTVCLWHTPGWPPLPIRWVLVVDLEGRLLTQAFFTTDVNMTPARVVEIFVWRWSIEVTFEEVRRHLGVETQRQWTDLAIARTTPVLMGLFSLVCLMVYQWREHWPILPRSTAWYLKSHATISDCLALVRRTLWTEDNCVNSTSEPDQLLISPERLKRLLDPLAATP